MNFCTYFDSYYLLKGMALYLSLEKVTDNFHLYVMAFDKECYDKLKSFGFKHMTVELLEDFETPELLAVKPTRTKAEYCWTAGPSVIWYFLQKYNLPNITYLDSDLYFVGDPQVVFEEIGERSIAITEQGTSKKSESLYGKYCVQYLYFKNDEEGCDALKWWRDSCIKWCYQRFENGLYADQKYLDQFPVRYHNLCVISNLGAGIAPWNMHKYSYRDNSITFEGKDYGCVFIHMHGLKMDISNTLLSIRSYDDVITKDDKEAYYNRYAEIVQEVLRTYLNINVESYIVEGIGTSRRLYYKLRAAFRNVKVVQWLYFKVFKRTYQGHGTKLS